MFPAQHLLHKPCCSQVAAAIALFLPPPHSPLLLLLVQTHAWFSFSDIKRLSPWFFSALSHFSEGNSKLETVGSPLVSARPLGFNYNVATNPTTHWPRVLSKTSNKTPNCELDQTSRVSELGTRSSAGPRRALPLCQTQ